MAPAYAWSVSRHRSPSRSFSSNPARAVARDAVGTGPETRYEVTLHLRYGFSFAGQATKAPREEYAFDRPATYRMLSYVSPKCRTTPLPREPYGRAGVGPSPITPNPWASSM